MQQHPGARGLRRRIEPIADDGVAEGEQVNPQLVRASGQRMELEERGVVSVSAAHDIAGRGGLTRRIDHRANLTGEPHQRERDESLIVNRMSDDPREVDLLHGPLLELTVQPPLRTTVESNGQDTRGVHVEAVGDPSVGEALQDAGVGAVLSV